MKLKKKILYLEEYYLLEFTKIREEVFKELSDKQLLTCMCGSRATHFHEMRCRKFNKAVDKKTCKLLKHLIRQVRYGGNTAKGEEE